MLSHNQIRSLALLSVTIFCSMLFNSTWPNCCLRMKLFEELVLTAMNHTSGLILQCRAKRSKDIRLSTN